MSFDELLRSALKDLARAAEEERSRAVAQAVEATAADVRRQAQAQLAQLRDTAEKNNDELRRATESRIDDLKAAVADSHQAMLAQTARIADAVRAIDEARALGEVLDALAESAGREVDRVGMLIVRNDRLVGWRLFGFSVTGSARAIDLSLEEAGMAGAVVKTGVALSRPAVEPGTGQERQAALPPFAQDAGERHAIALPVAVGGSVGAVLYADAPRLDTPDASSRWPAVLDVLARHASRALEALTVQHAVGLSLPRPVARSSHVTVPGPVEQAMGEADAARRDARDSRIGDTHA